MGNSRGFSSGGARWLICFCSLKIYVFYLY
jgi:hypothetical protein